MELAVSADYGGEPRTFSVATKPLAWEVRVALPALNPARAPQGSGPPLCANND